MMFGITNNSAVSRILLGNSHHYLDMLYKRMLHYSKSTTTAIIYHLRKNNDPYYLRYCCHNRNYSRNMLIVVSSRYVTINSPVCDIKRRVRVNDTSSLSMSSSSSSSSSSLLSDLWTAIRTIIFNDDYSNPKKQLERQYLYYALLLTHWRELRILYNNRNNKTNNDNNIKRNDNSTSDATTTNTNTNTNTDQLLFDQAVDELEQKFQLDKKQNIQLRTILQEKLQKQLQIIFQTFYNVDEQLHINEIIHNQMKQYNNNIDYEKRHPLSSSSIIPTDLQSVVDLFYQYSNIYYDILYKDVDISYNEFQRIINTKRQYHHDDDHNRNTEERIKELENHRQQQLSFLFRKLIALEIIFDFHQWQLPSVIDKESWIKIKENVVQQQNQTAADDDSMILAITIPWDDQLDAFGMNVPANTTINTDSDQSKISLVRYYQTLNLCRSACIKEILGYSIITLQSCITKGSTGRGTFVDCTTEYTSNSHLCLAGCIIAFQPGNVWSKEHLLTNDIEIINHFEYDPHCMVSVRFDDYVIDSRFSPVTVLFQKQVDDKQQNNNNNNNPWALGHMVNHPVQYQQPNALSCMLNYTVTSTTPSSSSISDNDDQTYSFQHYIPNTYARPLTWQSQYLTNLDKTIVMHGMCLIASTNNIRNQEIVYDYKLQQDADQYPIWYKPVQYEHDSFFGVATTSSGNAKP